jgi:DNA helicase-2/ATP-dependent DNA helicase PcrA
MSTSEANPFSWLTGPNALKRLSSGTPMIVYRSAELVSDNGIKSEKLAEQLRELRKDVPSLGLRFVTLQTDTPDKVRRLAEDINFGIPLVIFVDASLESVEAASCGALDGETAIETTLLADIFQSQVANDAIIVADPEIGDLGPESETPLSPIELKLYEALRQTDLEVECQVGFSPYVADFVVKTGTNRIIVEADGAEFHDPDRDQERDSFLTSNYRISVLRLTGTQIWNSPEACIRQIRAGLTQKTHRSESIPYEGLDQMDNSQKAPIFHQGTHARVLAPAGSGKTKVLVNRVVALLNQDSPPARILVVAFNKTAAVQLESRLNSLGVPTKRSHSNEPSVWVGTLNALGFQLLKNEGFTPQLLDTLPKEKEILRRSLKSIGMPLVPMRGQDGLAEIIRELARVRRGLLAPNDITLEIKQPSGRVTIPIGAVWEEFRAKQQQQNCITFDDQILLAVDLLLATPDLRHAWQVRFDHVLVDEYQDLNPAQVALLRIITSVGAKVFAVGDDDQMIYSWRGAAITNLLEDFEKKYPGTKTFPLEMNYRSGKTIVRCSQRLIQNNTRRFRKKVKGSPQSQDGNLEVVWREDRKDIGTELVSYIFKQREEHKLSWHQCAVLARTNVQLLSAAVALDRAGIPREQLPRVRLFSTTVGRTLAYYLLLATQLPGSADAVGVSSIINRPNRFVKKEDVNRLSSASDPWLVLNLMAFGCPNRNNSNKEVKAFVADIQRVHALTKNFTTTSQDVVREVIRTFPFVVKQDKSVWLADDASDQLILEIIKQSAKSTPDLSEFIQLAVNAADKESDDKPVEDDVTPQSRVALRTLHGAKGREWTVVSIFDAGATNETSGNDPVIDEEERRVFYVGMTRAIRSLQISLIIGTPGKFIREALLPKSLHRAEPKQLDEWIEDQKKELKRIVEEIESARGKVHATGKKIVDIGTGNSLLRLERSLQTTRAQVAAGHKRVHELSAIVPSGPLRRLVVGGMSSRHIERLIESIGEASHSLQQEIDRYEQEILAAREGAERELLNLQQDLRNQEKRLSSLQQSRQSVGEDLSDALCL